jgi:hypothetical protein
MISKRCLITAALVIRCSFALQAQELDKNIQSAFHSISPMDAYEYCKKISSREFAGRLTGDEGYTAAAHWAASKFKEWGLKPISKEDGYLQAFPSPFTLVDEAEMILLLPDSGGAGTAPIKEMKLKAGEDFLPLLFTDSGDTTASLVFAGWGISAPALGYDDYAGIEPAGRFVLCIRGTPDKDNEAFEEYDQHRSRMKAAKERGALGIIYLYEEPNGHPNGDWIEGFLPAMISEKIADSLFAEKGLTIAHLKEGLQQSKKPNSFNLSSNIRCRVKSRHFPNGVGYNVAAFIEGTDPKLRGECIVIGGHFDHCGEHLGMLFAGADDNASGSAVVLEIAEAFSTLKVKPKRSVAFVLFGGEEEGLVGSNYFAEHLTPRITKIDAMLNFDMDGEGEGTNCGYTPEPQELLKALEEADQYVKTLRTKWSIKHVGVRSSDFAPFFLKGAPCVACFSNGPHLHYHLPGDTIYRINPDMLADVARLGFLTSCQWANR